MLIDWFTVGAQALNFAILVLLLRRFLYRPILHAVDEREKRIARELADAAAQKSDASKQREDLQREKEELDGSRDALLSKARDDAGAERKRLFDEARRAADALRAGRAATLAAEARAASQALCRRAGQEVFAIARKTLADLATTTLEERMSDVLARRLGAMDAKAKEALARALAESPDPALVRSAFDLPAEQRAAIQDALNVALSADVRIRFETAPELVSGVEITAGGMKLGWSISDYLGSLEKGVGEILGHQATPEPPRPGEAEPEAEPEPAKEAHGRAA